MTLKMPRAPDKEPHQDNLLIDKSEFISLNEDLDRRYMRSISVDKLMPEQFGMDSWSTETFKIPDIWMKKIYQNDVYIDTDVEDLRPRQEKMSMYQRKLLYDWLKARKGHGHFLGPTRRSQTKPPQDELATFFEESDDSDVIFVDDNSSENNNDTPLNQDASCSDKIAICAKHRIQAEDGIVRIALEKMKNLTADEEKKYQDLLKDKEFMALLNSHVQKYISK